MVNDITGTDGSDTLIGGAGADFITGGKGVDFLYGGDGFDVVGYQDSSRPVYVFFSNRNNDQAVFYHDNGNSHYVEMVDSIAGFEGAVGSRYDDRFVGDNEANYFFGGYGTDTIFGGGGNDFIVGDGGLDTLDGGDGFDITSYSPGLFAVYVDLQGDQSVKYFDGYWKSGDTISNFEGAVGTEFNDILIGDSGANYFRGGNGDDEILGDAGSDIIEGGAGYDFLDGGSGYDILSYADSDHGVQVDLRDAWGEQTVRRLDGTWQEVDKIFNFEGVIGSEHGDVLVGNDLSNRFQGGDGADAIYGYDGSDTIEGGAGHDFLDGGSGIDIVSYADSDYAVAVDLRDGQSVLHHDGRWQVSDTISNFEGAVGSKHNDVFLGNGSSNRFKGGDGVDAILGYAGDDILLGENGDDVLEGGSGNDSLYGGNGSDNLKGGAGDDYFEGGLSTDSYNGGAGRDTVSFASSFVDRGGFVDVSLEKNKAVLRTEDGKYLETEKIKGIENIIGSDGNDKITGNSEANILVGGDGHDLVNGGNGNDLIIGDSGNDTMKGGGGDDQIFVNTGSSIVYGEKGNDVISVSGHSTDNVLIGGGGDDVFVFANSGRDYVFGGNGKDTVVLTGSQFDYTRVEQSDGSFSFFTADGSEKRFWDIENFTFAGGNTANLSVENGIAAADFSILGNSLANDEFILVYNVPTDVSILNADAIRGAQSSNGTYSYTIRAAEAGNVKFYAPAHTEIRNIGIMPAFDMGDFSNNPGLRKHVKTETVITKTSDEANFVTSDKKQVVNFGDIAFEAKVGELVKVHVVAGTNANAIEITTKEIAAANGDVDIYQGGFAYNGSVGAHAGAVAVANISGFGSLKAEVSASADASSSGYFLVNEHGLEAIADISYGVRANLDYTLDTEYVDIFLKNQVGADVSGDLGFRLTDKQASIQLGADVSAGLDQSGVFELDTGPVKIALGAHTLLGANAGATHNYDLGFSEDYIGLAVGQAAWLGAGYTAKFDGDWSVDGVGSAYGGIEGFAGAGVGAAFDASIKLVDGKLTIDFYLAGQVLFGFGVFGEITIDFGSIGEFLEDVILEDIPNFFENDVFGFFEEIGEFFEDDVVEFFEEIGDFFEDDVVEFFEDVGEFFEDDVGGFFEDVGDAIVDFFT